MEQPSIFVSKPPFLERLKIDEGVEKQILLPDYDILDELKNVFIKYPLLQAIKKIPIFSKTIRDLSIERLERKRKE